MENPAINTPQLVRALVDSDAQVYAVRPQTRDLETIYLECVNEGGGASERQLAFLAQRITRSPKNKFVLPVYLVLPPIAL